MSKSEIKKNNSDLIKQIDMFWMSLEMSRKTIIREYVFAQSPGKAY